MLLNMLKVRNSSVRTNKSEKELSCQLEISVHPCVSFSPSSSFCSISVQELVMNLRSNCVSHKLNWVRWSMTSPAIVTPPYPVYCSLECQLCESCILFVKSVPHETIKIYGLVRVQPQAHQFFMCEPDRKWVKASKKHDLWFHESHYIGYKLMKNQNSSYDPCIDFVLNHQP